MATLKLSRPMVVTWCIAVALGVLGLIGHFGTVAALSEYSFWLVTAGFGLLALATLLKNL
jgi:hypothetical protein